MPQNVNLRSVTVYKVSQIGVFLLGIDLPSWTYSLQIFVDISKTRPPFEMKVSDDSFIVYIYIYIGASSGERLDGLGCTETVT